MKHFKSRYVILLIFFAVFLQRLDAATFLVTNTNDAGAGSLRNAVSIAPSGSTIKIDPSLDGQTIYLTSGQIYINKNLEFFGPPSRIIISTNYSGRAFYIGSTASVSFILFSFHSCGYINSTSVVSGGAMYNTGNVFLRDSDFAFNTSSSLNSVEGGAVFNSGTMEIRANITGNSITKIKRKTRSN